MKNLFISIFFIFISFNLFSQERTTYQWVTTAHSVRLKFNNQWRDWTEWSYHKDKGMIVILNTKTDIIKIIGSNVGNIQTYDIIKYRETEFTDNDRIMRYECVADIGEICLVEIMNREYKSSVSYWQLYLKFKESSVVYSIEK